MLSISQQLITLVLFPIIGYADGQPVLWFRNVRYLEAGVGFLAATGVAVFNYFGAASVRTRQQMKIVLVSCFAALIPFLVLYLFPAGDMGTKYLTTRIQSSDSLRSYQLGWGMPWLLKN